MKFIPLISLALLAAPAFSQSIERSRVPGTLPNNFGFGTQVTGLGDTNADGLDDFAVWGLQSHFPLIGVAQVRSGEDGSLLHSALIGSGNERFADTLSATGDLNGDGVADYAMAGWRMVGGNAEGFVRAFSGRNSSTLYTIPYDPSPFTAGNGLGWGTTLADLGDLNGDGISDLGIGAPLETYFGQDFGSFYFYSGSDGSALLRVPTPSGARRFGQSAVSLGDINGDGVSDCLVSAIETNSHGAVYAISGSDGSSLFRVEGSFQDERFGEQMAALGDVDADGIGDFAVGTYRLATGPVSFARLEVYSGADGSPIYDVEYANQGALSIVDMAPSLDADGDGIQDLLLATFSPLGAFPGLGLTLHVSGADGTVIAAQQADLQDKRLVSVASLGDLNGDGSPDWVIGSSSSLSLGDAGLVQVMLGGCRAVSATVCMVPANSTGLPSFMEAMSCGTSLDQGLMQLRIISLPPNEVGYVLMSTQVANIPLAGSTLCLGGSVTRLNTLGSGVFVSDSSGFASRLLDWSAFPQGASVLPGSTWNFQVIHRDRGMPAGFHLSPALAVSF